MTSKFTTAAKIVVGTCAVIDAAAVLTLLAGMDAVQKCGAAWVLGAVESSIRFDFGIVPIGIALAAVCTAFLIPELRNPRRWLFSAALLTLLAVGDVAITHARFPVPTDPAWCLL